MHLLLVAIHLLLMLPVRRLGRAAFLSCGVALTLESCHWIAFRWGQYVFFKIWCLLSALNGFSQLLVAPKSMFLGAARRCTLPPPTASAAWNLQYNNILDFLDATRPDFEAWHPCPAPVLPFVPFLFCLSFLNPYPSLKNTPSIANQNIDSKDTPRDRVLSLLWSAQWQEDTYTRWLDTVNTG